MSCKAGKEASYFRYTDKQLRIALRRSEVQTEEFKDRYRWRSGVEATMSEFDRRTGVKRLRVRGMKAVRYSVILKAAGLNILRASAVMADRLSSKSDQKGSKMGLFAGINFFKERILAFMASFVRAIFLRPRVVGKCPL